MIRISLLFIALILILTGCAGAPTETGKKAPLKLQAASFSDLDGWRADNHGAALEAFTKSCARILKNEGSKKFGSHGVAGTFGDWKEACTVVAQGRAAANPRAFFETYFQPWQASAGSETEGLFTGYYEAALRGSRTKQGPYQTPLHLRPQDLVMVNLGDFRPELKGQRIAGRVKSGQLKPYDDRAAIVGGALDKNNLDFVYVDDPIDAFFLQVQGSGRIVLDDGSTMRVGYAAQNGHPYYAIGRELIKRGELSKDDVSMQSIRAWMEKNPDKADELMNTNKSYVFFDTLKNDGGPVGGEGVSLTTERSLAIDHGLVPYGLPVWLQAEAPEGESKPLRRLMVAQDTGGAIIGAVRGDVYWGYGPEAEKRAGAMKSKGRYWFLLPKGVKPNA